MTLLVEHLVDLPEREAEDVGDLALVGARLEAEGHQRGRGIRATVALESTGDRPIVLLNPFDLLQWQLLDGAGAPLDLPSSPPNLLVHRPASRPWELGDGVPVIEVRRAGELADRAMLGTPTVELTPHAELAVTFELAQLAQGATTIELPGGDYRLGCLATLIDERQRSRIVRCNPLPMRFERA
jgi:hypothetical protein